MPNLLKSSSRPCFSLIFSTRTSVNSWDKIVNPVRDLDAKELAFYKRYVQTGIACDFTFGSTEDDSATRAADPVRFITIGTAGINFGSSGDFSRGNSRKFTVTETFEKLLLKDDIKGCTSDLVDKNYAYPVAGAHRDGGVDLDLCRSE
jgi:hypothetical protein